MEGPQIPSGPVTRAMQRAAAARARATRAAQVAIRMELRAATAAPALAVILRSSAARQRESELRFRSVADLHAQHALRMTQRSVPGGAVAGNSFISAIADCLSQPSASLTLLDAGRWTPLAALASDAIASAAQNLELTLGEGPAYDVCARPRAAVRPGTLVVRDPARRWPVYGPALERLGVRTVIAAPLWLGLAYAGTLAAYGPAADVSSDAADRFHALSSGLVSVMAGFLAAEGTAESSELWALMDEPDPHVEVHQAAGMLSAQLDIPIADAYAVLRARAFAEGEDIDALAAMVLQRKIRFE